MKEMIGILVDKKGNMEGVFPDAIGFFTVVADGSGRNGFSYYQNVHNSYDAVYGFYTRTYEKVTEKEYRKYLKEIHGNSKNK